MLRRSDFIEARYAFSFVLANFGIAIAARIPMITTTIRSSISVKPLRVVLRMRVLSECLRGFDLLFAMQCTIHGWVEGNVRTIRAHRLFRLHPQRLARNVRCVRTLRSGSELRALLQSATAFAASHLSQTACCALGPERPRVASR